VVELLKEAADRIGFLRLRVSGVSMEPTITDGEVVRVRPVSAEQIRRGDVIVFHMEGRLVAHRVSRVLKSGSEGLFVTRGDAMQESDLPVSADQILGVVDSVERSGKAVRLRPKPPGVSARVVLDGLLKFPLKIAYRAVCRVRSGRLFMKKLRQVVPEIRDASEPDTPRIAEFLLQFHRRFGFERMCGVVRREISSVRACGGHYLLAYWQGRVIGSVKGGPLMEDVGGFTGWWVVGLYVDGMYRGLGIGERLVRELLERAKTDGATEVFCHVEETNTPSLMLFRKLGFLPSEESLEKRLNKFYKTAERGRPKILAMCLKLPKQ
jgi:signal peptidase I